MNARAPTSLFGCVPAPLLALAWCGAQSTWSLRANAEETSPADTSELAVPEPMKPAPEAAVSERPRTPPPAADASDIPPPSTWTTERVLGWSFVGAAAAASGLAVYFYAETRQARDAAEDLALEQDSGDQLSELDEKHERAEKGMALASATAVAFGAFGAYLLLSSDDSTAPPSTIARVLVNPSGLCIDVSGRF